MRIPPIKNPLKTKNNSTPQKPPKDKKSIEDPNVDFNDSMLVTKRLPILQILYKQASN